MSNSEISTKTERSNRGHIYAHWLDGEWYKTAAPLARLGGGNTLVGIAEGGLKLHALFGTRISISDVQLSDSTVTARAFANPDFRRFLAVDPGFLTLVTRSKDNDRFSRATNGIERAVDPENPSWGSSLDIGDSQLVKSFARSILANRDRLQQLFNEDPRLEDTAKHGSWGPFQIIRENGQYRQTLLGVLHGIAYFGREAGGPVGAPRTNKKSYLDLMESAVNAGGSGGVYGELEKTFLRVKDLADKSGDRYGRSAIARRLENDQAGRSRSDFGQIWQSVVHAWNSNVAVTVGANESIAPLPAAVFGVNGNLVTSASPFRNYGEAIRTMDYEKDPVLRFDPSQLSWEQIGEIVRNDEIRDLRTRLSDAAECGSPDQIARLIRELSHGLDDQLREEQRRGERGLLRAESALDVFEQVSPYVPMLGEIVGKLVGGKEGEELGGFVGDIVHRGTFYAGKTLSKVTIRREIRNVAMLNTIREFSPQLTGVLTGGRRTG